MSYFIQFAIGTETVKILTIHKISRLVVKLSHIFQNGENARVREIKNLENNWLGLSHLRKKSTGFLMIETKNILTILWIWFT